MNHIQQSNRDTSLPAILRHALIERGLAEERTVYLPLNGGRTNRLWRFDIGGEWFVCKLFIGADTPLFPNNGPMEARALAHLQGTCLAPELIEVIHFDETDALIYRYLDGNHWSGSVEPVGKLLAKLHAVREMPSRLTAEDPLDVLRQGDEMLLQLRGLRVGHLNSLRPNPPAVTFERVFLHGDPVPSNIVTRDGDLRLIDWQCPAIGDPTEDIGLFLSPAMQVLFGGRVLTEQEEEAFLLAYGRPDRGARYRVLAPLYHWRMAAYCLWKIQQGDPEYEAGYTLEIARL